MRFHKRRTLPLRSSEFDSLCEHEDFEYRNPMEEGKDTLCETKVILGILELPNLY